MSAARRRWRRGGVGAGLVLVAVAGAALVVSQGWLPGNNLHAVVPGQIYRSAQPDGDALRAIRDEVGLASIVAVRPPRSRKDWYQEEQRVADELGLAHYSIDMNPNRMPARSTLRELIERIDTAERPMLLHCRAGVERTGLASAVALLLEGETPEHARSAFGPRYGYVPGLGTTDLPRVLDRYEAWLATEGVMHTPERFRGWVDEDYVASFYAADITLQELPLAPRAGEPIELGVRITNRSEEPIPFRATPHSGVHVGTRVASLDPARPHAEAGRAGFVDVALAPGETLDVSIRLAPLPHAGRYRVEIDLVDEGVRWFEDMGSTPRVIELDVAPRVDG